MEREGPLQGGYVMVDIACHTCFCSSFILTKTTTTTKKRPDPYRILHL